MKSGPFVWPLVLLAKGAAMIALAQVLAGIEGFYSYGLVQGLGELVAAIGAVWLILAVARRFRRKPSPERRHHS